MLLAYEEAWLMESKRSAPNSAPQTSTSTDMDLNYGVSRTTSFQGLWQRASITHISRNAKQD
jgi:hypothetical protein